jgi:hypothetical protein
VKIYASLENDISEGHVWLSRSGLPPRCVVKITNRNEKSKKSVYCETLQFDPSFLRRYNDKESGRCEIKDPESSIVMSTWYREGLGKLKTKEEYALDITEANCWWGRIRACCDHPQIVVRVSIKLALLSVALGVVGFVLGVVSVCCG